MFRSVRRRLPVALLLALCVLLGTGAVGVGVPSASAQSTGPSGLLVTNASHSPETPTAGEPFELRVTIATADGAVGPYEINEVFVDGRYGGDRTFDDLGDIPPGESVTLTIPVTIDSPGRHTFEVNVNAQGPTGRVEQVNYPVTVQVVEERRPRIGLAVEEAVAGAGRSVNVTVSNGDATAVEGVAVRVSSPTVDFGVRRRVAARIDSGSATSFRFPATVDELGTYPVTVTVEYVRNGEDRRVSRTVDAEFDGPGNPGRVVLTGVEAVDRGGPIELSATASNVGSTPVDGVVVSVGDAPGVSPTRYFVGGLDASDFSSFTLTTAATGNVSTVPVTVRYAVDGVVRSSTREVRVERAPAPEPRPGERSGGPPVVPAVVGLVGVVAVALVARRVRGE